MTSAGAAVLIGLGANRGTDDEQLARFDDAVARLAARGAVRCSAVYRSAALSAGDPDFLNAAVAWTPATPWSPHALLDWLHAIEVAHGRDRRYEHRWGPRTLDLDVLAWGDHRLVWPRLVIPHPRAHERSFVLAPLRDLVGDAWIVPGTGATLAALAERAGPPLTRTAYSVTASPRHQRRTCSIEPVRGSPAGSASSK
ncbi:MAG: 2-amino-4-hydroxy-6-hydroxymethyldihydropteridine diphosphokinase [Kofleriaceae bacterium]